MECQFTDQPEVLFTQHIHTMRLVGPGTPAATRGDELVLLPNLAHIAIADKRIEERLAAHLLGVHGYITRQLGVSDVTFARRTDEEITLLRSFLETLAVDCPRTIFRVGWDTREPSVDP